MSSSDLTLEFELKRLRTFRLGLLRLHKTLLDSERVIYEQFYGRIQSPNEFFQLVISHDWFSWLRPISQFIVQIDDILKAKEPVTVEQINALFEEGRSLLQPNEEGSGLEKRYFHAIQRDPAIALMHADLSQLLPPARSQ
ncbi:MAG TPA: hypothetical protein V6C88_19430 [Chroococcidiopsis sp.]